MPLAAGCWLTFILSAPGAYWPVNEATCATDGMVAIASGVEDAADGGGGEARAAASMMTVRVLVEVRRVGSVAT